MVCPECGGKTTVYDGSFNPETNEYSRKRKCLVCNHKFCTMEFEVESTEQFEKDWWMHHRTASKIRKRRK